MELISIVQPLLLIDMPHVIVKGDSLRTALQFVGSTFAFYILSVVLKDQQQMQQCICIHGLWTLSYRRANTILPMQVLHFVTHFWFHIEVFVIISQNGEGQKSGTF